jgi:hypothetical protein
MRTKLFALKAGLFRLAFASQYDPYLDASWNVPDVGCGGSRQGSNVILANGVASKAAPAGSPSIHPYRDDLVPQVSSNSRGALFHLINRIDAMTAGITIRPPIATYAKNFHPRSSVSVLSASSWTSIALSLRLSGICVFSITPLSARSSSVFSFSSSAIFIAESFKSIFSFSFVCRKLGWRALRLSGRDCVAADCVGVGCAGAGCATAGVSSDGGEAKGWSCAADANKARHWDRRSDTRVSEGRIARRANDWTLSPRSLSF